MRMILCEVFTGQDARQKGPNLQWNGCSVIDRNVRLKFASFLVAKLLLVEEPPSSGSQPIVHTLRETLRDSIDVAMHHDTPEEVAALPGTAIAQTAKLVLEQTPAED